MVANLTKSTRKYMSAKFFVFQVLLSVVALYASHLFLVST